jgi:tripartite-type tricarboxylate transporter receptor subunit TctC
LHVWRRSAISFVLQFAAAPPPKLAATARDFYPEEFMRPVLRTVATSFVLASATHHAVAADATDRYPARPIRIVVGSTPGSTPDVLARLVGSKLGESLGQAVVVENRAPSVNGYNTVAKSTPDGHTLLLASPALAIQAVMTSNLPYDTLRDFAGVTELGFSNVVVVVGPGLGVRSVKELVEFAKARPGKVLNATGVVGGADHLTAERFKHFAGIKAKHVSFKGSIEALIEASTGRAHFSSTGLTAAMPLIQDGKLSPQELHVPMLPNVPGAADVVPGWKPMGAQSVVVRAGTPMPIRQKLSKEVGRILAMPDVRERLHGVAFHITPCTPEEHDRKLRADIGAFASIVKEIGLPVN